MSYSGFKLERNMVLRYVVPFYFESSDLSSIGGYEKVSLALENSERWNREETGHQDRDVYEYVVSSVCPDRDRFHIGQSWLYDFRNKPLHIRYAEDGENPVYHYWTISAAGMYVFKSNVGFLWYELTPAKKEQSLMNAEELIQFQYAFKELCRTKRKYALEEFIPRTSKTDPDTFVDFYLGKWVQSMLEPISGYIHYQSNRRVRTGQDCESSCESPDKALIFNYLLMDTEDAQQGEKELREMAYLLGNGQSTRYKIAEEYESQMVIPFGGVCWYACKGGCGYYALRNEHNSAFFTSDLPTRIRTEYFLLYILSLHQSYSLSNYLRRISVELPTEADEYTVPSDAGVRLDNIVAEVNTFLMKCMYFSVSHVHHQNVFFEYLQKRLRIREDIEGINVGTNAVVKLQRLRKENEERRLAKEEQLRRELQEKQENMRREQERYERECEQQREAESDRLLSHTLGMLSLLAIFSAFNDFTQFWRELQNSPLGVLDFHSAQGWQELVAYICDYPIVVLCYLIIIALSARCIYIVAKTLWRHKGSRKKRRK